ncbi:MAG: hypothetical protein ABUS56_07045, partial [Acidobacteriota bacterium]
AVGAGVAIARRRPFPRSLSLAASPPRTLDDILTAIAVLVTLAVAVLMFRAVRHQPVFAYDAWNFWLPKAKTIVFFGGIDSHLFPSLPAPSYPLLVPAVDAIAFRLAHSTDPSVSAQLDWFVLVGLVGALASLLAPLTRRPVLWLFLVLFVVMPEVSFRWFQLLGDWTMDGFFVISALLLVRWLQTRERWLLTVLPLPFAAMLATKREGQFLAACLVIAIVLAAYREWRVVAPRVLGAAVLAFVVSQLPWRIWWSSRHLASDLHEGGIGHSGSFHRAIEAARAVVGLLFSYDMWLLAVPLALAGCVAVMLARDVSRRPAVVLVTTLALSFVGFTWAIWSDPTMTLDGSPGNPSPIPREAASTALLAIAFAPVLVSSVVGQAWSGALERSGGLVVQLRRLRAALAAASPVRVLAGLVIAQWAVVLGIAAAVRHAGWIYYQGGDQLWYYTTGWLLVHGHFPQPGVGFLWPILLAPIALVTGPNVANAYPSIIVLQVLVLLPIALLAIYGIGRQIAGRVFGYWTAALWIVVPLIGIRYTDAGYHQRYTEALLPQTFGLTAMADLPATVAVLVSGYFCVRALASRLGADATAAGLAAGAAIAIKPSAALYLAGPALAFIAARNGRLALTFAAGLAPAVIALAFVKWRGFGYLPVLHSAAGVRLAAGHAVPLAAGGLGKYLHFNWQVFTGQLDQVREHFWSARLIEWLVVAGAIGVVIRSRRYGALIVGWFAATVLIKTGSGRGGIEGGNLLRLLMPAYPAFIVMLASLPFLVPGLARRLPEGEVTPRRVGERGRLTLAAAAVILTAVVPIAAYASTSPVRGPDPQAAILEQPPIPLQVDVGLQATRTAGGLSLRWRKQHAAGGPLFYHVFRGKPGSGSVACGDRVGGSADYCQLDLTDLGATT